MRILTLVNTLICSEKRTILLMIANKETERIGRVKTYNLSLRNPNLYKVVIKHNSKEDKSCVFRILKK